MTCPKCGRTKKPYDTYTTCKLCYERLARETKKILRRLEVSKQFEIYWRENGYIR